MPSSCKAVILAALTSDRRGQCRRRRLDKMGNFPQAPHHRPTIGQASHRTVRLPRSSFGV
eukprot:scaffold7381_cov310-Pinguiococcus_pyrenoidosus.AAC.130